MICLGQNKKIKIISKLDIETKKIKTTYYIDIDCDLEASTLNSLKNLYSVKLSSLS